MNRLKQLFDSHLSLRNIGISMGVLALIIAILGYIERMQEGQLPPFRVMFNDFYANVVVDLLFTALTILVIDTLDDRRERQMEKERLTLQMGSPNNTTATEAVRILRFHKWLTDGSLREAFLEEADLSDCNLTECQLQGAKMTGVKLVETTMQKANLYSAMLSNAQMQDSNLSDSVLDYATLYGANLQNANLSNSSLKGANLMNADLRGANLYRVDLTDANLRNTDFTDANLLYVIVTPEQLKRVASLRGAKLLPDDL